MELVDGSDLRRALREEGGSTPSGHRRSSSRWPRPSTRHMERARAPRCQAGQHPCQRRRRARVRLRLRARPARRLRSSLTGDRGFVGTIDYVPPEQIEGGTSTRAPMSTRSAACSTSASPACGPSSATPSSSVVFAHLNEPPPRLTDARPELPAAFDEVFATALAKQPGRPLPDVRRAGDGGARRPARQKWSLPRRAGDAVASSSRSSGGSSWRPRPSQQYCLHSSRKREAPATITPTSIAGAHLGDSTSS